MTATKTAARAGRFAAVRLGAVLSLTFGHLAYAGEIPVPPQAWPPECAPCMEPSDGVIRIPCPVACRRVFAARSGIAATEESCHKLPGEKAIVRLNFRPDTDVMEIVGWIHTVTCIPLLVPTSIRGRTITVKTYRLLTVQECKYVFLAALGSVGFSVEEAGESLRVIEVRSFDKSERRPGVLFSKFPVDRLTLIATAVGVRARGVLRTPAGPPLAIGPGDRLSGASARVAEILDDRVVFELPTVGALDMDPSALMRITLQAPLPIPATQPTGTKDPLAPSKCDSIEPRPPRPSPRP